MIDFVCWVAVVALGAAFLLSLAIKWGWLEWLQVHAPSEFLSRLFNCRFCCSWWVAVVISVGLSLVLGRWEMLLIPVFSTLITRDML